MWPALTEIDTDILEDNDGDNLAKNPNRGKNTL